MRAITHPDSGSGLQDLNTLRANRIRRLHPAQKPGLSYTMPSPQRKKRAAFEGHRFFDFKRLGQTTH